jgi:hypothetical protein
LGSKLGEKLQTVLVLSQLKGDDSKALDACLLGLIGKASHWQTMSAVQVWPLYPEHELGSETASKLMEIYAEERKENTTSAGDFLKHLVRLTGWFDAESKSKLAQLLFEGIEESEDDYLLVTTLRALCKIRTALAAIPENTRTRVFTLLEDKRWPVADAAFEVALRYELI